jgi:hypothetical protein
MTPCKITKQEINRDKALFTILSEDSLIYFLSSKKMQTGPIHENKQSFLSGKDLIQIDRMGYKTIISGIDRYMVDEKKCTRIAKLLK